MRMIFFMATYLGAGRGHKLGWILLMVSKYGVTLRSKIKLFNQHFIMKIKNSYWYFLLSLVLCSCLFIGNNAAAQSDSDSQPRSKKNFYIEGGGNALAFSVNYDARFQKRTDGFGYRIGIGGFTSFGGDGRSLLAVPVQINYLAGKGAHFFEAGLGATYTTDGFWEDEPIQKKTPVLGTITFGYRFQPVNSGLLLRVGMTPFFGTIKELEYNYDPVTGVSWSTVKREPLFWPLYGGVSVGYTF